MLDTDGSISIRLSHQYATALMDGTGRTADEIRREFAEWSVHVVSNPVDRDPFETVHPSEIDTAMIAGEKRFPERIAEAFLEWAATAYLDVWRLVENEEIEYTELFQDGMVYVECSQTMGHWVYLDGDVAEIHIGAPDVVESFAEGYTGKVRRVAGRVGMSECQAQV